MRQQFHPVRDLGTGIVTMVNQVLTTGINTAGQLNAGIANTALSLFNATPAPPTPPAPPAVQLPNLGGGTMNIAPTGVAEEDFDVVE
jgi:hypothetical protein